jgi:hypothetical protein
MALTCFFLPQSSNFMWPVFAFPAAAWPSLSSFFGVLGVAHARLLQALLGAGWQLTPCMHSCVSKLQGSLHTYRRVRACARVYATPPFA